MNSISESMNPASSYGSINTGRPDKRQGAWCKFKSLFGHKHNSKPNQLQTELSKNVGRRASDGDAAVQNRTEIKLKPQSNSAPVSPNVSSSRLTDTRRNSQLIDNIPITSELRRHSTEAISRAHQMSGIKNYTNIMKSEKVMSPSEARENTIKSLQHLENMENPARQDEMVKQSRIWGGYAVALGDMPSISNYSKALNSSVLDTEAGGWRVLSKTEQALFWNKVDSKIKEQTAKVAISDLKKHCDTLLSKNCFGPEEKMVAFIRISNSVRSIESETANWGYWSKQMEAVKGLDQGQNLPQELWDIHNLAIQNKH